MCAFNPFLQLTRPSGVVPLHPFFELLGFAVRTLSGRSGQCGLLSGDVGVEMLLLVEACECVVALSVGHGDEVG